MVIKINYTSSDVYVSTSVSPVYVVVNYSGTTSGGGGVWGSITGTLSDQTDLQDALDDKVPYSGATGDVNLGEYGLSAGQLTLDTTPTGTAAVGTTRWNDTIGSSETTLKGGSVILKNGVDLVARVVNKVSPNTTLTKAAYQAVKVSGAQGQRLAIALAQANNDANSADTIGLVTETIATNQEGFIMTVGNLEGINTTGSLQGETWADGDVLYLSPTTAGRLTNIKPTGATGHIVVIGYVEYAHSNNGKIYVKTMNGWELDELHNVSIDTPLNNQVLTYESSTSLWKNKTPTSVGTTIYSGDGTLAGDRIVTSNGNSLTILGGKEATVGEQTALILQTSATNKGLVELQLNNTFTTTGKNWRIRSLSDGALDFAVSSIRALYFSSTGKAVFNGNTSISNTTLTVNGDAAIANGLQIQGGVGSPAGAGIELEYSGGTSYFTSFNRSGSWLPIIIRGSQIDLFTAGSVRARLTSAGRLLLGTTTESTYIFDAVGSVRINGQISIDTARASYSTSPSGSNDFPTIEIGSTSAIGGRNQYGALKLSRSAGPSSSVQINPYSANNLYIGGVSDVLAGSVGLRIGGDASLGYTSKFQVKGDQTSGADHFVFWAGNVGRLLLISAATNGKVWNLTSDNTGDFILGQTTSVTNSFRIFGATNNIGINTGTDAGYKLDVNGTARVSGDATIAGTIYATSSSSNGVLQLNQTAVGFAAQVINRVNTTNTSAQIAFQDLKTGAGSRSFAIGIGRSGDPQWTNGDFIFSYYNGSGGWQQSAKIFNASGNWAIENGNATSDITSALFQVNSTTKGFLPPRGTNTQMLAIASPVAGLMFYDTTNNKLNCYDGTTWQACW